MTFLMPAEAADAITFWPVSTLPMSEIRLTAGWRTRASPVTAPGPDRMFTTPGGNDSRTISAISNDDSGA